MSAVIEEFLNRDDVTTSKPAPPDDIRAVERRFATPLPESILNLWRASNGVTIEPLNAHVPGPTDLVPLLEDDAWGHKFAGRGLIPMLDDHESNYLAVCVRHPLAFRVLHQPHDDGARVLYRNLDSCFRALMRAVDAGETADLFLFNTDGDYPPDEPRPEVDQQAAKSLLAMPHTLDEWNHATQLLDATNLQEWARLLETDHFVRRDVRARMQQMRSPAIRQMLQEDELAFEDFSSKFIIAAHGAGLPVGKRDGQCVRIGKSWYDLEFFFHRRNTSDAMPRMLAWIQDQLSGRDPYSRPRNLFTD